MASQKVCIEGSFNSHGGSTSAKSPNVYVNSKAVIRQGDAWQNHVIDDDTHSNPYIIAGSSTVYANGKSISRYGDSLSCGAIVTSGSSNVYIG